MIVEKNMHLQAILLILGFQILATESFNAEDERKIDDFITGLMNCSSWRIPGVSFSLVQNGQTLMAKGYGVANVETGEPVTSKTKFCIGSSSKAFNSALLAKVLSNNTSVTWDTPVREVFGDWFYLNGGYMSNKTSLRDLLAHKTGVPRNDLVWVLGGVTREELLRRIRFHRPIFPYRTSFLYNNNMHITAGEIVRVLQGKPWDDSLKELLLDPLVMSDTLMFHQAAPAWTGFARPYSQDIDGNLIYIPFESLMGVEVAAAAGGVSSTAEDMAKWLKFHLSGGQNENGDQVVETGALERTKQSETPLEANGFIRPEDSITDIEDQYALSWFTGFYRGYRKVTHGGSLVYTSLLTYLPDMDVGVFVSVNVGSPTIDHRLIHAFAIDIALGLQPWLDLEKACNITNGLSSYTGNTEYDISPRFISLRMKSQSDHAKANRPLEEYAGTYGNFGYGNMTVSLNSGGDQPHLELSYGTIGRYNLIPTGTDDEFFTESVSTALVPTVGNLRFRSSNNQTFDEIETTFEQSYPPIFKRDLKQENAPPPPNNNC